MKRVILIRTCPLDAKGSMPEYARLVETALVNTGGFEIGTCDLFPVHSRSMWHDHVWRLLRAKQILQRQQADLFHLLDGSMLAFVPRVLLPRTLVTVHDVIPWLQLQGQLPGNPSRAAAWIIRWSMEKARYVASMGADSMNTSKDVMNVTRRHDIHPIPLPTRSLPVATTVCVVPQRFVLHVGNNASYKNRMGVLHIFARLHDCKDLWLVMVGPAPTKSLQQRARAMERVRFLVDVPDADLAALYQRASLLLFPSLYEGFGMPVREAQAAGCPVVCSTAASLPEVAGGAALMAPADAIDTLADHCRTVLKDEALRMRLRREGQQVAAAYTMERFGRDLVRWYESVGRQSHK